MRLSPQGADVGNGFAVGGGNYRQSFVTVDGAAFNNTFGLGGNLPANGSPISLDALEQVTVAVTPFDVRQSGFTGGAINAVTRSGDNQFRGTAYLYFNNENLKGSKVDDYELLRSKAQYYTYGASFGGPIIKDKLFFFVNGEYEDNVTAGSSYRPRTALGESYSGGNIHRPLQSDMDDMRGFLLNKYNFDPGKYNDYSTDTPAYRVMARVDWNANQNNKVNKKVVTNLILAGAFDETCFGFDSQVTDRINILREYFEIIKQPLPEEFKTKEVRKELFWKVKQKELTGLGKIDYKKAAEDRGVSKNLLRDYIDYSEYIKKPIQNKEIVIGGKVNAYQERMTKTYKGVSKRFLSISFETNSETLNLSVWDDYLKINKNEEKIINSKQNKSYLLIKVKTYINDKGFVGFSSGDNFKIIEL
jgi:hypothetical protein